MHRIAIAEHIALQIVTGVMCPREGKELVMNMINAHHYFNFKYPRIESNKSIIRKIQSTLNSVCITYVLGADLNHEKGVKE